MKPYLLDVNVLIALAWKNHVHSREAQEWFSRRGAGAFRVCPITQTAFVRISSNPAFSTAAVTPAEAIGLLRRIADLPGYGFWPDDLSLTDSPTGATIIAGHRQVTDKYLLDLAGSHDGILATLDRGAAGLGRSQGHEVELLL